MIRSQRLAVAVLPAVFVIGATLLHAGVTPPAGAAAASPSSPAAETAPPPAEAPAPAPPPGWSEKDKDPSRIERGSVPLEVTVGAGLVLTTPSELERVALADDTLARVTVLSKREVMLNGLAAGRTTLFLWLTDTRRLRYVVVVRRDLGLIERVVKELDDRIDVEASPDGNSVILRGDVENQATAEAAVGRAEETLRMLAADPSQKDATKVKVLNLLRYTPVVKANADDRLQQALAAIDGRIRVRRIQVGTEAEAGKDAVILEGKVRSISALMRAITLAERQLGGSGSKILAADERRRSRDRSGSFSGISGAGATGSTALNGNEPPPPGIAAQIARGLVLTSESGRVVSFLSVDRIQQIQVAIRVLEIDRSRARTLGVDYRIDGRHFSISGLNGPAGIGLPSFRGEPASVTNLQNGNLVGAYVDSNIGIGATFDALENLQVARSVAEPNILTLSGEEATVLVGGEIPIPIAAVGQITTIQSVAFREFGVRLDIRPTAGEDDVIALEVSPSIVRPTAGLVAGSIPGFQVQSVQTTARVQAGQSLVIGGLLNFEESKEERKIPILGDIPLLKAAFRWERKTRRERELLFVITPRLMATSGPESPVELPTQQEDVHFGAPAKIEYTLEERRKYSPRHYEIDGDRGNRTQPEGTAPRP